MTLQPVNDAEKNLLEKLGGVSALNFSDTDPTKNNLNDADKWEVQRHIRGEILAQSILQTSTTERQLGVLLIGAKIVGQLNLSFKTIPFPITFLRCFFEQEVIFLNASFPSLAFTDCRISGLLADRADIAGNCYLGGTDFQSSGEVRLLAAHVRGQLIFSGGKFNNPGKKALSADGVVVDGDVFLDKGFSSRGEVQFPGAKIGGEFSCSNAIFQNEEAPALRFDLAQIGHSVRLCDGFVANGEVRFLGANIGGQLFCENGKFENRNGKALSFDQSYIKGGVFFTEGFKSVGEVRLLGVEIDGQFNCNSGTFENVNRVAIAADNASVKSGVQLVYPFRADGEVRFSGANLGSNFDCGGARFSNSNGTALRCDGIQVGGTCFLNKNLVADGRVSFIGAKVGGQFDCSRSDFRSKNECLVMENASVAGFAAFSNTTFNGVLNLSHASVGQLVDNAANWPPPGKLLIDGFTYAAFAGLAPTTADARLRWLRRQPIRAGRFWPQPYEQTVKALRSMGHDVEARRVAIAKQEDLRRYGNLTKIQRAWNLFLGLVIGHGYRPWNAVWWIGLSVVIGWCAFQRAEELGIMRPVKERVYLDSCYSKMNNGCVENGWVEITTFSGTATGKNRPSDYPAFDALWYSIDVFLPIVDLHQEENWQPTSSTLTGMSYRTIMWVQILVGWFLTTLFVVGVTGIVKKE